MRILLPILLLAVGFCATFFGCAPVEPTTEPPTVPTVFAQDFEVMVRTVTFEGHTVVLFRYGLNGGLASEHVEAVCAKCREEAGR